MADNMSAVKPASFIDPAEQKAVEEFDMFDQANGGGAQAYPEREEIAIKFSKKLVSEPFMSKAGKSLVRVSIPNRDLEDHTPWSTFVLGENQVHDNKFGKGVWAKIPADGYTTVSKPTVIGEKDGKKEWQDVKTKVPNRELKEMVEFYKTRSQERESSGEKAPEARHSVKKQLEKSREDAKEQDKKPPAKAKAQKKSEPSL